MAIASQHQSGKTAPTPLRERYDAVRQRLDEAARRSGRSGEQIVLVVVTKNASMDQIRQLLDLGHVDLGESRVQQFVQRSAQIEEYLQRVRHLGGNAKRVPEQVRWHMIGHLQRNKVRRVAGIARLIHSVDSLRLAEEIQGVAARLESPVEVLVQINVSGEKSKFGVAPAAAPHLVEQIDTMINVRARGLMCMAPFFEDPAHARPVFERGRELFDDIQRHGIGGEYFDILSMGMSNDFEVAVECGANVVRVGTAIFGDEPVDDAEDDE